MVLEKCVIRDLYGCKACKKSGFLPLIDRKKASFPLVRSWEHRNILYNSVPIYMADRMDELTRSRIIGGHFIFTDETPEQIRAILTAYEKGIPSRTPIRRIGIQQ
ncbi:MAG: hypothetical protein IJ493_09310 [Clostridia bacterium]|nr:hypothetical protein [Clostridia bacterium]